MNRLISPDGVGEVAIKTVDSALLSNYRPFTSKAVIRLLGLSQELFHIRRHQSSP